MAHLYEDLQPDSTYVDKSFMDGPRSQYRDREAKAEMLSRYNAALRSSTTLYVGNLSFFTTEEQIYQLFAQCGPVKRIIMGLDREKHTPCGFCFVEYEDRKSAENCIYYVNGTKLDDRIIRTDWDAGFKKERQYGRGRSGGQVRDEFREDYDAGRGGYGNSAGSETSNKRKFNSGSWEDRGNHKRQRRDRRSF
mmetsp:Transcript_838/g.966  ORF Transcript_838/g.966 Transcript_838/m.966 type:complete len:193 (-) Transcript_838:81-659(-)